MQITKSGNMKDLEIPQDLKDSLENNQTQLKVAIRNHQNIFAKLQVDPDNVDLQKELSKAEEDVVMVGLNQKTLLEKLRAEFKNHTKSVKANTCRNGVEDRKQNLAASLVRTRKQNIVIKPLPQASFSDESNEESSGQSSPERILPVEPHEVTQSKFLAYFGLGTHDTYREMQNRRVERKRRSTANPHFLYGNKGWDFLPKRKRNNYLASSFSPPNTRQAVKKRGERTSPPSTIENGTQEQPPVSLPIPSIPNLPSGLTIERVSPSSSPELSACTVCKQSSSNMLVCEICQNNFHVTCHNRPLPQIPRRCPRCFTKELPVGLLMTTQISPSAQISEKIEEKQKLQDENLTLCAELTQLQDRHSQLSISLKNQKNKQEELLSDRQSTEEKIKHILNFIEAVRNPSVSDFMS